MQFHTISLTCSSLSDKKLKHRLEKKKIYIYMSSTQNNRHHKVNTTPKEEDDRACIYAMLLSSFQVLPAIVNAAIELNLFDIISQLTPSGSYISPSEIEPHLPTKHSQLVNRLDRMLRVLASFSVLDSTTRTNQDGEVERLYRLSLTGKYFLQNQVENLAAFSNLSCHPAPVQVWLNLKEAILDGGIDLFNKVHGTPIWKYMEKDTKLNQTFNSAMAGISAVQMRKYLEVYDGFEGVSTLVDVGGGTGQSLQMILCKHPNIKKAINFDLPQVIQHASPHPGVEHVGGNMYESVPKGDVMLIKATCHNWPDDKCVALLRNCYKSLPENGKVIILDMIMPEEAETSVPSQYVSIIDNTMFTQAGGKERTEKEFAELCRASGFSSYRVVARALSVYGVIEFYK